MKTEWWITGLTTLSLSACMMQRRNDDVEVGSRLSEVSVNLPTKDKYPSIFGGAGCPEIKLPASELRRLGVGDPCEAAAKLLDEFKLTISQSKCEAGITGTNKTLPGKVSQNKLGEKVVKGCSYDVLLEIGEVSANKIYYSNGHQYKAILDVPKSAPASIQLKIELMVTEAGVAVGFPKTEKIITDADADLSIDATIGSSSASPSPAPSASRGSSPSPGPSARPSASPTPRPSVSPSNRPSVVPIPNPGASASAAPSGRPDLSIAPPPPASR
jgi:hypothetical protein